jgi:hypothetical protein
MEPIVNALRVSVDKKSDIIKNILDQAKTNGEQIKKPTKKSKRS